MLNRDIEYMTEVAIKLKYNFFVLLLGLVLYIFWYHYGLSGNFTYKTLHIHLGHIGYIILLLMPSFLVIENNFLQRTWVFFSGLAILDLLNLVYITNNYKPDAFTGYTIIIFIFLIFFAFTLSISKSITSKDFSIKKESLLIVFLSSLFFMIVYHCSNFYLNVIENIKNEDRSILIRGLEIHHINYGIVLLVFIPLFFKYFASYQRKYFEKKVKISSLKHKKNQFTLCDQRKQVDYV